MNWHFRLPRPWLTLSQPVSILILFLASGLLAFAMFMVQPMAIMHTFSVWWHSRLLIPLLNWSPIFFSMLVLFFLTNNVVIPMGIVGFVVSALSLINRYKIILRNDPLFPWDFSLGAELMFIAQNFPVYQFVLAGALIVIFLVGTVLGAALIRTRRGTFFGLELMSHKFALTLNFGMAGMLLFIMFTVNGSLYSNVAFSRTLPVQGSVFNPVSRSNSWGFLYHFILTHNTQRLTLPDDFDSAPIQLLEANFTPAQRARQVNPHVIMIMSEAFSDMGNRPEISFEGFNYDPHYYWNQLVARPDTLSGHIVVPNVGGGTGDTEFDVLTALNTRYLRGAPYAFRLVNHYFEAIPHLLAPFGYRSIALHPGHNWFYNRQNVYRFFGFEHFYHLDYFNWPEDWKGPYVSEEATFDKLIDIWEDHLLRHPNTPLFQFTVTIQNHGPYHSMYGITEPNFSTTLDFTDHEMIQLANFFHGLHDLDTQLMRLIDYFEASDEPVVLVYFSDHAPGFTSGIFSEMLPSFEPYDSMENLLRLHTVPYLIWQNAAARAITPLEANAHQLLVSDPMGSNFLGAYVLELLGFTGVSSLWDHVNGLRRAFPVVLEDRAFSGDGLSSLEMPLEVREGLVVYRNWHFYRLLY